MKPAKKQQVTAAMTVEDLREIFIKKRIREHISSSTGDKWAYDYHDPEAALRKLRTVDRLPIDFAYQRFDSDVLHLLERRSSLDEIRLSDLQLVQILDQSAEELGPQDALGYDYELYGTAERSIFKEFDEILAVEGRRIYLDNFSFPVYVFVCKGRPSLVLSRNREKLWIFGRLNIELVASIVLATWRYGSKRRAEAREFICNRFAGPIAKMRDSATREFNEAVAVKSDGSEVIRADQVVIFDGTVKKPQATLFPCEAFRADKLVIPANKDVSSRKRKGVLEQVLTAEEIAPFVVSLLEKERIRALYALKDATILFSHRSVSGDFLPPEGNVLF